MRSCLPAVLYPISRPRVVLLFCLFALVVLSFSAQAQVNFPGSELLGRPTDHSVTINVVPDSAIDAYFEYGAQAGGPYTQTSPASGAAGPASTAANVPLVVVLGGLNPNTQYFYRMVYRPTGGVSWTTRDEHSFFTQRPPGSTFTFTITSDSHLNNVFGTPSLFQQTLSNVAGEHPDFHLDLGDTFPMDSVTNQTDANSTYLGLRPYFGVMSASVPVFLAIGNHAEEEAWHLDDTGNIATSQPILGANARNQYYLNPDPLLDPFYTGNTDTSFSNIIGDHTVQDYYAWQWGDALFVVFDPYWYTTVKPFIGNMGGGEGTDPGSGDRWDWSLGIDQYLWLKQTLESSTATYKFLFAHQVAGGMDDYGRGGANAVPYVEWGGYDTNGTTPDFSTRRPGWPEPVHQMLVDNHVTVVFHGHDHEFAYEKRDGVVYQLTPMAADATYGFGFQDYHQTDPYTISVLPNTGHLRVTVAPSQMTVDYVRAFLPGDGTNGQVAYTYSIVSQSTAPDFSISGSPSSQTVVQGGSTSYTTTVGALNGFSAGVNLSVTGLPNGTTFSFTPNPITGAGSSTLQVNTSSTTPVGTYTLTISGTSGTLSHTSNVTLVVNAAKPDFTLSASPGSQTVAPGSSTTYTATVGSLSNFGSKVSLTVTGLPSRATATFSPTSITRSGNSTLRVTTNSLTPVGTYTLTLTGTSGTLRHTNTVALVVSKPQADFTLTASPGSQTVVQGNSVNYTATVGALNNFASTVALSVSGLPSGVTSTFTPTSITRSGSSTLKLTASSTASVGTFTLTITGVSGSLTHSTTVTLVVNAATPDFTLSAASSSQTVTQGGTANYTATVAALNGFAADVALSVSGAPNNTTTNFDPPSISTSGSSALQVITTASTPVGTYTLTITGTSGNLTHSANVTLVVNAVAQGDFGVSVTPSSKSITQGGSGNVTATVSALNGFAGTVTLSVTGLPSGVTATFNPTSITRSGYSGIQLSTNSRTPVGTYTVTITGTSGSVKHSANVTLVIKKL